MICDLRFVPAVHEAGENFLGRSTRMKKARASLQMYLSSRTDKALANRKEQSPRLSDLENDENFLALQDNMSVVQFR